MVRFHGILLPLRQESSVSGRYYRINTVKDVIRGGGNMVPPAGIEPRMLSGFRKPNVTAELLRVVPPAGIEPATPGLGNLCSILLS
jgi:hypothetical protein